MRQFTFSYTTVFEEEPEGGYTAIVPSLPGCITYGRNMREARINIREAIELCIETMVELGEEIPAENTVKVEPTVVSMALAI
jgi:antitoxin HicB